MMLGNVVNQKDLIYQLFRREFFAGYKKSFVGSAWIIFSPLAGIISWVFLHRTDIIKPGDIDIPYPAYILVGTSIWGLFMGIYGATSNAISNYRHLLMHTKFPHEVIYCVQILVRLAHFIISFFIILIMLILFRVFPSWWAICSPIVLLPLLFTAISVGLIISMFSIVSYDIKRLVSGAMGLLLFITPVIYSAGVIKNVWIQKIIYYNPLTHLICSARDVILYGRFYSVKEYLLCSLLSLVLLILSWRIFYLAEDKIVERMI
jgi:lipopolysaccharide transport system permease protein